MVVLASHTAVYEAIEDNDSDAVRVVFKFARARTRVITRPWKSKDRNLGDFFAYMLPSGRLTFQRADGERP